MSFHLGQKVVCIDDDWSYPLVDMIAHVPRKGAIYHVRDMVTWSTDKREFLTLCELTNPPARPGYGEPWFAADHFRPIVERKTDISIFTKLLTPEKEFERVS